MAGETFLQKDLTTKRTKMITSVQIGGAGSANRLASLNASGQWDISMMPTGVGAETRVLPASEALSAGDLLNIFDDSGTTKVRKADATSYKPADGFTLSAVESGANATVYLDGINTAVTGLTGGEEYYLSKTAGGETTDISGYTTNNTIQFVGKGTASGELNFERGEPIVVG